MPNLAKQAVNQREKKKEEVEGRLGGKGCLRF